jgi:hypothetical protein
MGFVFRSDFNVNKCSRDGVCDYSRSFFMQACRPSCCSFFADTDLLFVYEWIIKEALIVEIRSGRL